MRDTALEDMAVDLIQAVPSLQYIFLKHSIDMDGGSQSEVLSEVSLGWKVIPYNDAGQQDGETVALEQLYDDEMAEAIEREGLTGNYEDEVSVIMRC